MNKSEQAITFPDLETERLLLRQITDADADDWLAVHDHPKVMEFLADFEEETLAVEEVPEIIQWTKDINSKGTGYRWAITIKPDSTMIGSCGFHLYSRKNRCAEIGYELHHDYWSKGVMREALTKMLRFGFKDMNLHRIEATVTVGNERSASLLKRLGFSLEGTMRDKSRRQGEFLDLWLFSLLECEFSFD